MLCCKDTPEEKIKIGFKKVQQRRSKLLRPPNAERERTTDRYRHLPFRRNSYDEEDIT
jgi:hypothetical protein